MTTWVATESNGEQWYDEDAPPATTWPMRAAVIAACLAAGWCSVFVFTGADMALLPYEVAFAATAASWAGLLALFEWMG